MPPIRVWSVSVVPDRRDRVKALITGASGLLGTAATAVAVDRGYDVVACPESELDVTDPEDCSRVLAREAPEVVVHCAAYTAVDRAETERETAFAVNERGARNVARAAAAVDALLLYPSTDYVFGGERSGRPWAVDDPPAPSSVYARSKWAGEEAVRHSAHRYLIVRTSWLYGPGGTNFVDTICRLAATGRELRVVDDQRGRPTWAPGLASTLLDLLEAGARGTLHVADRGTATWYALARAALALAGIDGRIHPVSTDAYGAAAPRPSYSVLDLADAEQVLGRSFPHWRTQLRRHLSDRPSSLDRAVPGQRAPPGAAPVDRDPSRSRPDPPHPPTTNPSHPTKGEYA